MKHKHRVELKVRLSVEWRDEDYDKSPTLSEQLDFLREDLEACLSQSDLFIRETKVTARTF